MKIFGKLPTIPYALTIGNFDGVHLGHQKLISELCATKYPGVALTFDPHPTQFFGQGKALLMTLEQRIEALLASGLQAVCLQNFDYSFANLNSEEFYHHFIRKNFSFRYLMVGHDFRFGQGRNGDFKLLKSLCDIDGIPCTQIPQYEFQGTAISSSHIRSLLQSGNIQQANVLLGMPFVLAGSIVHGDKKGRLLGFPTANLGNIVQLCPAHGVYVGRLRIEKRPYVNCVVNIGVRPTITDIPERRIEAHLLDFNEDIYGKKVTLQFLGRLRNEMKFPNLEALKEQIGLDIMGARRFFGDL